MILARVMLESVKVNGKILDKFRTDIRIGPAQVANNYILYGVVSQGQL